VGRRGGTLASAGSFPGESYSEGQVSERSYPAQNEDSALLVFTPRADTWLVRVMVGSGLSAVLALAGLYYYGPPEYTRVGYAPAQPIKYSHEQHAGRLGLSCLYCHTGVEESPLARIPATQTCMNCHQAIKPDSPQLEALRVSWASGDPVHWVRVHQTPDYVFFNHAVHVKRGVGCVSCHGKVNEMPVVVHDKPLSMGWCLDCHRHPEEHLRPPGEVTNFAWQPPEGLTQREFGLVQKERSRVHAPEQCSGCHR
jgi:Cytochrome c7 and related cytochrome c